jgi:hypothetical protein
MIDRFFGEYLPSSQKQYVLNARAYLAPPSHCSAHSQISESIQMACIVIAKKLSPEAMPLNLFDFCP